MKYLLMFFLLLLPINGLHSASASSIKLGAQVSLIGSIFVGFAAYKNAIANKKPSQKEILGSISKLDPEFYQCCKKVANLSAIKEELDFVFYKFDTFNFFTTSGYYQHGTKKIYINYGLYKRNRSLTIATLVHELEHYRQFNNYSGSYQGRDSRLLETGADAAAAGFFECLNCLKKVKDKSKYSDLAKEGYFCSTDYQCYVDRLNENSKICEACKKSKQWPQKDAVVSWSDYLSLH